MIDDTTYGTYLYDLCNVGQPYCETDEDYRQQTLMVKGGWTIICWGRGIVNQKFISYLLM